ncbi:hypothetical protein [Jiangella alba]|uniref:AAA domain-containing protein n=1 Tax=Jiangella alba TaxID=561176 RepID=A0A1H5DUL8_9ACTN|nr:hypothetical protein [Jiangella alba]SED82592.1 hypothetical protein SAMN04488561_0526 [Jiangella alba]
MTAPGLWVCGPRGVGKSTAGFALFLDVLRSGVPAGYVDLAQIGFLRPAAPDDPDGHRLRACNLAGVWAAYRAAGAHCLVISGDADQPTIARYAAAVPDVALAVCRLRAEPATLRQRLRLRGEGRGPAIPGDELRGLPPAELDALAAEAATPLGDGGVAIDTDGLTADEVAGRVRAAFGGWPGSVAS